MLDKLDDIVEQLRKGHPREVKEVRGGNPLEWWRMCDAGAPGIPNLARLISLSIGFIIIRPHIQLLNATYGEAR